jgi:rRNA-processing protein CGR1
METAEIRGGNVSGRPWKSLQQRASSKAKANASRIGEYRLMAGYEKRQEILKKDKAIKDMIKEQLKEKQEQKQREKELALERKRRREENERRAEVVQKVNLLLSRFLQPN